MNRRYFFLAVGFVSFGMLMGMFVMKLMGTSASSSSVFSTESVSDEVTTYACPWSDKFLQNKQVIMANPVSEKAFTIVSLQSGLESQNYEQRGPIGATQGRKAIIPPIVITGIDAVEKDEQFYCLYQSVSGNILQLRNDMVQNNACTPYNTLNGIGFSCED